MYSHRKLTLINFDVVYNEIILLQKRVYSLIIFMNSLLFSTVCDGNLAHLKTNTDTLIPIRHIIELIPELTVLFTHIPTILHFFFFFLQFLNNGRGKLYYYYSS